MTRTALITGGQQGIGLGIAAALAGAGFAVALAAEAAEDAADPVRTALAALGPGARYYRHDMCDVAAAAGLVERVEADMGPLDTLVSNAGVPAPVRGDMLDVTPESFDLVLGVNLRGGYFLACEVARRMAARRAEGFRSMVFVTSVSAAMVSVERAEYCISKAGASMMTALFAARLAPLGIGIYELRPGIVATAMTAGVRATYDARIPAGLDPAGRRGTPADVAEVALALVEGRLAFATGAVIPVDGGLSIPQL